MLNLVVKKRILRLRVLALSLRVVALQQMDAKCIASPMLSTKVTTH